MQLLTNFTQHHHSQCILRISPFLKLPQPDLIPLILSISSETAINRLHIFQFPHYLPQITNKFVNLNQVRGYGDNCDCIDIVMETEF